MKELILKTDGQEITVYAEESELAKLTKPERARTGYERVNNGGVYYAININGVTEYYANNDKSTFDRGNYVNDEQLCKDRYRARVLHDRLEQWQALNDETVDWGDRNSLKYFIYYDYRVDELDIGSWYKNRFIGTVYFSTEAKAQEAIEVFHDELMWYFTQYRSRMDEPERKDDK